MRGARAVFAIAGLLAAAYVQAAVRASLGSTQIGVGDSVQLTLQRDGQSDQQPNLAPLKQDFDVLSVGTSSSIQIINGHMSSQTQAQVILSPKHAGQLTVPPIDWGGESSQPLTLVVTNGGGGNGGSGASGASAAPSGSAAGGGSVAHAGAPVFLETQIDERNPYVQAAVPVTVRLYTSEQLYQASLNFPSDRDLLIQQVGSDAHYTAVRNGTQYQVVERHYVLFPQRSGSIDVPGDELDGQVAVRMAGDPFGGDDPFANLLGGAGMMNGTKPIRVRADPITLEVRPRPAAAGNGPWLPATDVALSATWQPPSLHVAAGDPLTLDLRLKANGLTAAQLPDVVPMLALPAGLKAYPDAPKLENGGQGEDVVGTRDQTLALIADRPGRYTIPALHLAWWDTKADQARSVDLPAQTIEVAPVAPGSANAAPPAAGTGSGASPEAGKTGGPPHATGGATGASNWLRGDLRWIALSAALALLWIGTLIGWWASRRRPAPRAGADVGAPGATGAGPEPKPVDATVAATQPGAAAGRAGAAPAESRDARPSPAKARTVFQDACRRNDADGARQALLAWAAAAWKEPRVSGLQALATRFADPRLAAALADLDRACYAGGEWDGAALAALLAELPKSRAASEAKDPPIGPLYH
ncbi:MAG: protein BatD [Gammaproteobacteria bacterium]|nr:protein BatD [Gammaproteobacteria bacterium]